MKVKFDEREVDELRKIYEEFIETRREYGASAYGSHYLFV